MMWGKSPGEVSWMPALPSEGWEGWRRQLLLLTGTALPSPAFRSSRSPVTDINLFPDPAGLVRALKPTKMSKGPHQPWQPLLVCCSTRCFLCLFLQFLFVSSWHFVLGGVQQNEWVNVLIFQGKLKFFSVWVALHPKNGAKEDPYLPLPGGILLLHDLSENYWKRNLSHFPSMWGALGHCHESWLCPVM